MSEFKFIPTLWAGAILKGLQKKTVFEGLCNKDYIGEVKKGNILKIATVNNPTVSTYTPGTDITYELATGSDQSLTIDQQKYFAFKCDDIVAVQSAIPVLESMTEGAGYALADTLDQYLAGLIESEGALSISGTVSGDIEFIAQIAAELDKAKAPDAGRWIVVPPDFSKSIMVDLAGKLTNNVNVVTSGYLGTIFGVNIYKSVNAEKVLVGCTNAVTLANQIEKTEQVRMESAFATGIRGLHVYGATVTRPELCGAVAIPGA